MIEKVIYEHHTARLTDRIDIEIWVEEGKVLYNKRNFLIKPNLSNFEENAESPISVEEFEQKLANLKIEEWDDICLPPKDEVYCDGFDWKVIVKYEGKNEISKTGENAYPANWNKFIKLLKISVGDFDTIKF